MSPCFSRYSSPDSDYDEDEVNYRVSPHWPSYRLLFKSRGFCLDTVRDVKHFYIARTGDPHSQFIAGDDDALCPDLGLPDNLFRGTRAVDGLKVVVKAVHRQSREFDIIRFLSTPPMRDHPMNHCIPVLDLITISGDDIAFIVMEEWSSQLICDDSPCCLHLFLVALRQCIEHAAFMHSHNIAHLDISLRNLLTDFKGHYSYIDFELSRRFSEAGPRVLYGSRGTEIPPECDRPGEPHDPFKIDVWALAVLIIRACQLTEYCVPGLMAVVKPMLNEDPALRPRLDDVLKSFDCMLDHINRSQLPLSCPHNF